MADQQPGPVPVGAAVVVLARTSVPPCFSVMPMPKVTDAFSPAGRKAGSYRRAAIRGIHSRARFSLWSSAGTTAWVMVIGQWWPASTWQVM